MNGGVARLGVVFLLCRLFGVFLILLLEVGLALLVLLPLHLLLHITRSLEMLPLYRPRELIRTHVRYVLVYRCQNADAVVLVLIRSLSIALRPEIFEVPLSNNKLTSLMDLEGD